MTDFTPEIITREAVPTAVVTGTVSMADLRSFYDGAYPKVAGHLASQGRTPLQAFGLYRAMREDSIDLEVGFTTDGRVETGDDVIASELPGGEFVRVTHTGPYDGLGESWQRLEQWIRDQDDVRPGAMMFEVYVDDPQRTEADDLRTDLYWPLER